MKQFDVIGMSCAACSTKIEKKVLSINGVTSCSVNLLTNSMTVNGSASNDEIIKSVKALGYGINIKGENKSQKDNSIEDMDTPILKRRFFSSLIFLIILMYFSMGHTMFSFPLPSFFSNNPIGLGIVQMLLSIIIMIINKKFFIRGFKGMLKKAPNMDSLVALGSSASFVYSVYILFLMTILQANGEMFSHLVHYFYFESTAMILVLITVGKILEAHSKGKTTNAIKSLMNLAPKTALIIRNDKEVEVPVEEIKVDDIFIVKAGASIPVDALIIDGSCSVDESSLTGESIPIDKIKGDNVSSATVVLSGYIKCRATKVGKDTTLSQIIKMISDAAATKAPIAKIADKVSGFFVPTVIGISILTIFIWLICGEAFGFALARGITVLVISCPCALGLATPVAIMVGNGVGAKSGILFKNAASLEETGRVNIVALDKTGTITNGKPVVTDIIPYDKLTQNELLTYAYSLEIKSEHPLAKAIISKGKAENIIPLNSDNYETFTGNGLSADINGLKIFGGNFSFVAQKINVPSQIIEKANLLASVGKTPIYFTTEKELLGIIAVADTIKSDSPSAIKELKNMGIRVVMLTGDNQRTADAIKKQVGVNEVISEVMPSGKEQIIRDLKKQGKVAMVGDGINDAPALTSANVGIAIGTGTEIAIDSADIVLMNSYLSDVPAAIRLSRATLKNIKENLFWAFVYNIIGIPLAAGALIPLFNMQLNPMFAAAAMSLSSFCVVTNALRLNFTNIYNSKKDKNFKGIQKEKKTMEITLKIEGMMCPHCEANVKKTLEAIDGVDEAIPSHTENKATVKLSKDIPFDTLKSAIEEQGYKVID